MLTFLRKDGNKKRAFRVEGRPVNATPLIVVGYIFVANCDSSLHVNDTRTGREMRRVPLDGQVGSTGTVVGGMLYVGTMTNEVQGIDWKNGKIEWTFKAKRRQQPFFASVAVTDDLVIATSKDKRVDGLDRKTGHVVWSFLIGGQIDSSPMVVSKRVSFGAQDHNLYCLGRDGTTLEICWNHHELPPMRVMRFLRSGDGSTSAWGGRRARALNPTPGSKGPGGVPGPGHRE